MADNMAVTGESVMRELTNIGQMAYGVKYGHGAKGGNGYIGMMGDKVIKFNTHWQERRGPVTDAMRQSCDGLRLRLYDLARHVYTDEGQLTTVRKELGLDAEGRPLAGQKLLERTVVAKMVTSLSEAIPLAFRGDCPADTDVWKAVKAKGPTTQENTNYADLRKTADTDDFRHAVKFSLNKLLPKPSAQAKNANPVDVFATVRGNLDALAGAVFDGTKSLKKALGALVNEVRDVKRTAGLSDSEAIVLLRNLSRELNAVAVRGRQARGEKPSFEKPSLMLAEQRTVDAAIDRITDAIMKRFVDKCEQGDFEQYARQISAGLVDNREVVRERVECEILSSDDILRCLTTPTDREKMSGVADFIRDDLKTCLGTQQDIVKGTVGQAVVKDFAREVNSTFVASIIKIDGVGMDTVFDDANIVPTEQEIREICKGSSGTQVGGVRVAKKIIDCVPPETPARKEIVSLITNLVIPVTGPSNVIGQMCDLGFGLGYEYGATGKIKGLTDFEVAPPSFEIQHLDGKIVFSTTVDVGADIVISDMVGGQDVCVLIPRNRITYEVTIPLGQKAPATPEQLEFTVTARSQDVHLY